MGFPGPTYTRPGVQGACTRGAGCIQSDVCTAAGSCRPIAATFAAAGCLPNAATTAPRPVTLYDLARRQRAITEDIYAELDRASKFPPFNSAHEGYGVLLVEMDKLKAHVWAKQKLRNLEAMRAEAIQVAAMAFKFVEMIDAGRGRV